MTLGLFLIGALNLGAQTIPNASFESPGNFNTYPGYAANNGTITGWSYSDSSRVGLNTTSGPFVDIGSVPDGTWAAFIQSDAGATTTLSTTITGLTAGVLYKVTFSAGERSTYGGQALPSLSLNGGASTSFTVTNGSWGTYSGTFTATGTTAALSLANTTSYDSTVLLDNFQITAVPTVTSPTSASITGTEATLGGNVTSDGGSAVTERGVVYAATATNASPAIGGTGVTKVTASGTTGVFTAAVSGLSPGTGYSFAAYATNSVGTTYTSVSTFTTMTAPTDISLSASSIAENNAAGATVGTLSTTDVDVGDTFTYTLVSGTGSTDNASFSISGSTLKITPSADYETKNSYSIRVRSTDAGNLYFEKQFTISITDVNEAPTIASTIANASDQLVYETVTPTRSGNNIVYSVNNAASLASAPFTRVHYRMELTVAGTPYYADTTFDAWSGLTVAGLKVPDGSTPLAIQRNVTNMTVDSNYPGVVNGTGQTGRLEIWPSNYGTTANGGVGGSSSTYDFDDSGFDTGVGYGSFQVHNLSSGPPQTVLAWNQHGSTTPDIGFGNQSGGSGHPDWTFSNGSLGKTGWKLQISINSLNTFALTEDVTGNLLFTGTPFTDDSASLTVTLGVADGTITGNAGTGVTVGGTALSRTFTGTVADLNSYFTTAGKITYLGALNNNTARTLSIAISDGTFTTNASATINLAPVDDAPTDIALSASSIAENNAAGAAVGTLSTTDVDTGDTFTYTLVSGTGSTDNASFSISGSTLKITPSADYETKNSYSIRVRSTDSGSLYFEKQFTISITDVNEAPVITTNGGGSTATISLAENISAVTTVQATDPEVPATQTLTHSKSGADAALFTLDSSSGVLSFVNAPNYEVPLDAGADNVYNVTVTATDSAGSPLSDSQSLSITITDVVEVQNDVSQVWTTLYGGVNAPTTRRNGDGRSVVVQQDGSGAAVAVFATGFTTNAAGNKDIYTVCYNPGSGAVVWEQIYNGSASGADEGYAAAVDGNGDVIVTGYTTNASGNWDVITLKYAHADGAQVWKKTYAGAGGGADVGVSVSVDASNNVAVAGYGTSSTTGMDVFGARYAADGSTIFEVLVDGGGNSTDLAYSVDMDSAGNVIVGGYRTKSGFGKDLLVMKLAAATGASQWTWVVNGSANSEDQAYSVVVDAADAIFVTGSVRNANYDLYLAKLNSAGSALWANQWNSSYNSSDAGFALVLDSNNNVVVAGSSYTSPSVQDGYVAKYRGSTGALIWDYRYDDALHGNNILRSVAVDKENKVIASGYTQNSSGNYDVATIKLLGTDGALQWEKIYNGAANGNDEGRSVAMTATGQAYVTGYSTSASGTTDFFMSSYSAVVPSTQNAQTITFANPGTQSAGTALNLAASSDSGLTVRFAVISGAAQIDASSNTLLNFTGAGSVTVRATQSGSATYAAATPVDQTFTVNKSSQTINFTLPSILSSSAQWPLAGVAGSGLAVTYSIQSGPGSISGGMLSFSGTGTVTVRASQAGDARYNAAADVDAVVTVDSHSPVVIFNNIVENWRDFYAGSGAGQGNDLALQLSGNEAVAGFIGGYTTTSTGKDMYLAKYLKDGTLVWSSGSAASGDDEALAVEVDGNGDLYVAGYVTGTGQDIYVAKYNGGTGAVIWSYTYNGTGDGNDVAVSLDLEGSSNVVVGAYAVGSGTSNDFYAAKLSQSTGAVVWTSVQNRTGTTSDVPAKVLVGSDGGVVLAGATSSDAWTVKLAAADGSRVWQQVYNYANKPDSVRGLALDSANNVYITALSQSANYDMYTAKYDATTGVLIWGVRFNGSYNSSDGPWDIVVDESANIYVAGSSYRAASQPDGITLKYAGLDGSLQWQSRFNLSGRNAENLSISLDGIGHPVVAGYAIVSNGTTDVSLMKCDKDSGSNRWLTSFDGGLNKSDGVKKVKADPNGNVWTTGAATTSGGQLQLFIARLMPTL